MGLPSSTGAGLLAGFNFSSAVGRIFCGLLCDIIGPLNTLFISLMLTAISMLVLWPTSTTLAPLAVFVVINGAANGGFFSTMPTVVGNVFGSARISIALGMIVTGWVGGYLMAIHSLSSRLIFADTHRGHRLQATCLRHMEVSSTAYRRIVLPCSMLGHLHLVQLAWLHSFVFGGAQTFWQSTSQEHVSIFSILIKNLLCPKCAQISYNSRDQCVRM